MTEFIVSILDDENDGDFSDGDLSLREAIALANDTEGADTITFDPSLNDGTITLIKDESTGRPRTTNLPLIITDSVIITGSDENNITIDGNNGGRGVFEIGGEINNEDPAIDVTVEGLTIANGAQVAFSFPGLSEPGGSFFVSDNASFTLQNSVITGSSASIGGAVYNRGTTNIIDSTIENSSASGDGASSRPARTDGIVVNRNLLNISDSEIRDNDGSAIFNIGTLEVSDTSINNNTSIYAGGAIDNRNIATIVGSNVSGNSAPSGSGIRNTDNLANRYGNVLTIDDTVIEGNISTSSDNNAIVNQRGTIDISSSTVTNHEGGSNVGIVVELGTLDIRDSTISDNRADQAQSGIIVNPEATANINNSTIANNEARSNAGIENFGTVNLNNNTIANNTGGLGGGGLRNFGNADITSNIVANNSGGNVGDISGDGTLTSGGNNLIGNANDVRGLQDSDLTDVDPQLSELQNNGGSTETIALLNNSVAIDAGSNPNNLDTDQRGEGFDRTVGDGTDIGAFEVQDEDEGGEPEDLVVSTLEDENDGDFSDGDLSLREAIAISNSGDTITFDSNLSDNTISLTLGELVIDKDLTIQGLGANNLTIDGGSVLGESSDSIVSRVFNINDGDENYVSNVTIEGLTITGGNQESLNENGGGILNQENLTLRSSIVEDNFLDRGDGGGIANYGNLFLDSSLVSNNSSGFRSSGGGILNTGTAIVVNSTIAGNSSFNPGGGIANTGSLTVENSTITQNDSGFFGDGISGSATITSSIVAGNQGTDLGTSNITSGGNNIIGNVGDATGLTDGENDDLVGTNDAPIDPLLGDLQDNGGAIPTQALLEDSPAIDAGSNPNNLDTDQRGEGFDRTVGDATDIGAFEVQNSDSGSGDNTDGGTETEELVVSTLKDENDDDFSDGDLSLREAIAIANETEGADTITFDESLSGGTISLDESLSRELIISDSVTIEGLGQDNLTLNGGFIFNLPETDANLTIDGLNLRGGMIDSFGTLTFSNSTLRETIGLGGVDNSSLISRGTTNIISSTIKDNDGGGRVGLSVESGTTNIVDSAITENDASFASAGININPEATVNISNSTIANNRGRSIGGISNGGTLNVNNSTLANNTGGLFAGGIVNSGNNASTNITSSILTENGGSALLGDIFGEGFISGGNNLISNGDDGDGFVNGVNGDIVGSNGDDPGNPQFELLIDPRLGELENNGGSTETFALLDDSPAINAGSNPENLTSDQRGEGFDRTVGDSTDIGAFEVQDTDNSEPDPTSDDIFTGTNENDSFDGSDEADLVFGQDGYDTLNGNNGNDTINGGAGNDILTGGSGDDLLDGDAGDDFLHGDEGNDILIGGDGNDTLVGGDGNDTLFGGNGHDVFVLASNEHQDRILDFSDGRDRFELTGDLSFEELIITGNESNSEVLILDGTNHDAVIAVVENVSLADINAHDFVDV